MSGQVQMFSSIVQYVARQRETNNNTRKSPIGAVRCLFGVPDRRETKLLIEEELRKQRETFFKRWEVLEDFRTESRSEPSRKRCFENDENEVENPAKRLVVSAEKLANFINASEKTPSAVPRRVLQPRNDSQTHITDFWTSKKTEDKLTHKAQKYPKI